MKRRKATLSLGIVVGVLCLIDSANAIPVVSVSSSSSAVSLGDSFSVSIDITGVTDLYGFQFDLLYDGAVVHASDTTEGSFLANAGTTFFIPGAVDNVNGRLTNTADTLIGPVPGASGNGTLASLVFSGSGAGTALISLSNVLLIDPNFNLLASTTSNASVQISSGITSVPEPSTFSLLLLGVALVVGSMRNAPRPNRSFGVGG